MTYFDGYRGNHESIPTISKGLYFHVRWVAGDLEISVVCQKRIMT